MSAQDTQLGAATGDNSQADQADYASLLGESDGLDIEDPNEIPEQDAADAEDEHDEESEGEDKADGQDAKSITDEATVKLDGRDVSVRELKETFTTFQRKAQELAQVDSQREYQARTAIASVQEEAAHRVAAMAQGINDLVLPGIDMQAIARMRLEDPARAGELLTNLQIVERWKNDMMAKAKELWDQGQAQRSEADQKQKTAQTELLQAEAQKLSQAKWFNDDFKGRARSYLKSHGIPEQFVGQLNYAGAMEILHKAMSYDKAQASIKAGKQPSQSAQQPSASGKAKEATNRQRADAAFQTARKTGSRKDAARAYSSLLG